MDVPRQPLFTNRKLVLLILPLIFEQLLSTLVGMVDTVMVSSVGEAAISSVSLVGNISGVILNLLAALSAGGSIVTSQLLGAGKPQEARRSAGQIITMTVGISTLLGLFCILLNRPLLSLCFQAVEPLVMDGAVVYFFYNALSFPFLGMCSAGAAIMRANGNSKITLYISLLRNTVNIVGNAICIYGLGMGVEGVAIPTALSRIVGAAVYLLIVKSKKQSLRPDNQDILHINGDLMGRMLRVGLPTALENSIFQLGRVMTLSMITGFGTYQIAANSTANTVTSLIATITVAFRMASLTVIGQCVGARDPEQIQSNFRKLITLEFIVHTAASLLVLVLRYPILSLFTRLSPNAVELAAQLISIYVIPGFILYPLSFFTIGPLRAVNDSTFPMWVSILSMAIFRLTLAQLLCVQLGWGAPGVWWGMIADWLCRSICFTWRWACGAWKKKCGLAQLTSSS